MRGRTTKLLSFVLPPVIALGVGAVGYKAFNDFSAEPEVKSPFRTVAAQSSQGMTWLDNFISTQPFDNPNGGDSNKWGKTPATRTLLPNDSVSCAAPQPMPPYVMDVKAGTNSTITITAALTQPGMAKTIINDYESRANDCNLKFNRNSDSEITVGSKTTLLFYGDTIVSIAETDNATIDSNDRNEIIESVRQRIISSLEENQCVNVHTAVNDRDRNLFYTIENEPTGLFITEDVHTTLDTDNLPTMVDVELDLVDYPNLVKPEGPFPANFPEAPEKQESPHIPELPQKSNDTYVKSVTYEAADFEGPGCGWEWSIGQQTPSYDIETLEAERDNSKTEALRMVNESASNYVNHYLATLAERVDKQDDAVRWNNYVNNVNDVHNRWMELKNAREAIRSSYNDYVYQHNHWSTFEDRKRIAQDFYDKQVEYCEAREENYLDWLDKGGERRSFKPAVCGEIPAPSILLEDKGPEPQFQLPPDVTIPSSWEKPGKNLDSLVNQDRATANANYDTFVKQFEDTDAKNKKEWEEERTRRTTTPPTTTPRESPTTTPTEPRDPIEELLELLP